jgi:hypothetical protein
LIEAPSATAGLPPRGSAQFCAHAAFRKLRAHAAQIQHFCFGLRFVAAVILRCSGDKSDKEESAAIFLLWGLCNYFSVDGAAN